MRGREYGRRRRGVLVPSLVAGVIVALLVAVGAVAFASSRPTGYEAEAQLVVLPREGLEPAALTAYYETLSRGQIVGTFAEVLQLDRFVASAADDMDLTPAELDGVDVDAAVIPESSMISLTVRAADARSAESLTDGIVAGSADFVTQLSDGYVLELVSPADGTAAAAGLSGLAYAAVMVVTALVLGAGAQQVVQQMLLALDRRAEPSDGGVEDLGGVAGRSAVVDAERLTDGPVRPESSRTEMAEPRPRSR